MTSKNIIKDLRSECQCENIEYCPCAELIRSSERLILQHKLVEKLKYIESKKAGKDIGWTKSYELWCDEGYAKKFSEIWKEEISYTEILKQINLSK